MKSLFLIIAFSLASLAHAQTPVIIGGTSTGGPGVLVASAQALAQTANVTPTLLYAVPAGKGGWYAIVGYTVVAGAAQTSGTLPSAVAIWNEQDTGINTNGGLGASVSTNTVGVTNVAGTANVKYIHVSQSTNVQWNTTGYASVGSPSLAYNVYVKLYYVGP